VITTPPPDIAIDPTPVDAGTHPHHAEGEDKGEDEGEGPSH
jgi:hypothetical protein